MDVRRRPDGPTRDALWDEVLWSLGLVGAVIALVISVSLVFGA